MYTSSSFIGCLHEYIDTLVSHNWMEYMRLRFFSKKVIPWPFAKIEIDQSSFWPKLLDCLKWRLKMLIKALISIIKHKTNFLTVSSTYSLNGRGTQTSQR